MNNYQLAATLITLAIGTGYANHRFIRLPTTIALMLASLILSILLIFLQKTALHGLIMPLAATLKHLDFHAILIQGMLSFLLFAGALTINFEDFTDQKWEIIVLATLGTLLSTFLVGGMIFWLSLHLDLHLKVMHAMLFGALISPTDPIAVLAIFSKLNVPRSLSIKVEGESLFNDGVGIVIFLTLYQLTYAEQAVTFGHVASLFLRQAIGGIGFGLFLGWLTAQLIHSAKDHKLEILLTIALTTGGYTLANHLNISGALAMVSAGMLIGNHGRKHMQDHAQEALDTFWELIDELLNAALFLLIGFELLILNLRPKDLWAALAAIPIVLFARYLTVATPMWFFQQWRSYKPHAIHIMVWGGLRGGLAVALALALPASHYRHVILVMTYSVVAFSIIVQGLTLEPLLRVCGLGKHT